MSIPQNQSQVDGQNVHGITLQVMRLRQPDAKVAYPVLSEEGRDSFSARTRSDYKAHEMYELGSGFQAEYRVPKDPGQLYVGETFTCFLSLHNQTSQAVPSVNMTAELFINTKKTLLLDTRQSKQKDDTLKPGQNRDFKIQHPLYDKGVHVLCCSVTYGPDNSKSFRRMFEFNVKLPLSMNALLVQELKGFKTGHILVRMNLENITDKPLHVEKVSFLPDQKKYDVQDLSAFKKGDPWTHQFMPGDFKRFLFELIPRGNLYRTTRVPLGKIEFRWKGNFGEGGILTTAEIYLSAPQALHPLEVTIEKITENIKAEQPFTLTLRLLNRSNNPMSLIVLYNLQQMFPVLVDGRTLQQIGKIDPGKSILHDISLISLREGIHTIGAGIAFRELNKNQMYSLGTQAGIFCHDIFVAPPETSKQLPITKEIRSYPTEKKEAQEYVMEETNIDALLETLKDVHKSAEQPKEEPKEKPMEQPMEPKEVAKETIVELPAEPNMNQVEQETIVELEDGDDPLNSGVVVEDEDAEEEKKPIVEDAKEEKKEEEEKEDVPENGEEQQEPEETKEETGDQEKHDETQAEGKQEKTEETKEHTVQQEENESTQENEAQENDIKDETQSDETEREQEKNEEEKKEETQEAPEEKVEEQEDGAEEQNEESSDKAQQPPVKEKEEAKEDSEQKPTEDSAEEAKTEEPKSEETNEETNDTPDGPKEEETQDSAQHPADPADQDS